MPKRKHFTETVMVAINSYKEKGDSNRDIDRIIGRSENVIRNYLKKGKNMGINK